MVPCTAQRLRQSPDSGTRGQNKHIPYYSHRVKKAGNPPCSPWLPDCLCTMHATTARLPPNSARHCRLKLYGEVMSESSELSADETNSNANDVMCRSRASCRSTFSWVKTRSRLAVDEVSVRNGEWKESSCSGRTRRPRCHHHLFAQPLQTCSVAL